jgi:hypothetical protein
MNNFSHFDIFPNVITQHIYFISFYLFTCVLKGQYYTITNLRCSIFLECYSNDQDISYFYIYHIFIAVSVWIVHIWTPLRTSWVQSTHLYLVPLKNNSNIILSSTSRYLKLYLTVSYFEANFITYIFIITLIIRGILMNGYIFRHFWVQRMYFSEMRLFFLASILICNWSVHWILTALVHCINNFQMDFMNMNMMSWKWSELRMAVGGKR